MIKIGDALIGLFYFLLDRVKEIRKLRIHLGSNNAISSKLRIIYYLLRNTNLLSIFNL